MNLLLDNLSLEDECVVRNTAYCFGIMVDENSMVLLLMKDYGKLH